MTKQDFMIELFLKGLSFRKYQIKIYHIHKEYTSTNPDRF